jgi:hypothetical protein
VLDRLISRLPASGVEPDDLVALAPFLNRATLAGLARRLSSRPSAETIAALAPFADHDTLEALIRGRLTGPVP